MQFAIWNIYQLWITLNKRLNHFTPKNEDLPDENEDLQKTAKKTKTVGTHREAQLIIMDWHPIEWGVKIPLVY